MPDQAKKWLRKMLEAKRALFIKNLVLVQGQARGYVVRRAYRRDIAWVADIQRVMRGYHARIRCRRLRDTYMRQVDRIVSSHPELPRLIAAYATESVSVKPYTVPNLNLDINRTVTPASCPLKPWIKHRCDAGECAGLAEVG